MSLGGNDPWKEFWHAHPDGGAGTQGRSWEETTIEERYAGQVGEEWKERLSAKVEGREYVPVPRVVAQRKQQRQVRGGGGRASPARSASPASSLGGSVSGAGAAAGSRKAQNESFFALKGHENASRSAHLPPSLGGKYAGFGSELPPQVSGGESGEKALPGVDDFQRDPVAALTKGFGWFTTTVGKGAKSVNKDWIQPAAQKVYYPPILTPSPFPASSPSHSS